jgi:Holliday junction resolvase-like predicted endonuclease
VAVETLRVSYEALWRKSSSVVEFGQRLASSWCDEYLASTGADPQDIVTLDPGNGFRYDFDLAGSLREAESTRAPRVVGVWGLAREPSAPRDTRRMRGHPRSGDDDRGHLIAHTAGGEYEINLVPMNRALNRGWSRDGKRFREMERVAAAVTGSLFFVRLLYSDATDRPTQLEVGVMTESKLLFETFPNPETAAEPLRPRALRRALALPVGPELVRACMVDDPRDELFERAWVSGISTLSGRERSAIAGVTGHVAESLAVVLLAEVGWHVLWQFATTGGHGIDLLMLSPDQRVVAIEVKGTLVAGHVPNLSRRRLAQMSRAWVDKPDNPGMHLYELNSSDVYGAVITVNFVDLVWRCAFTNDFVALRPVEDLHQLADLAWLDERVAHD